MTARYFRIYANTTDGHLSNRTVCVDGGPEGAELVARRLVVSGALSLEWKTDLTVDKGLPRFWLEGCGSIELDGDTIRITCR